MSTTQKKRTGKPLNHHQKSLRRAITSKPDAEEKDYAYLIRDDVVTHIVLPVEDYERLVMESMELEVLAEMNKDDEVEWVDAQEWALQLAGDKIKETRRLKKLTQKQLAEKLGIPQSQISRIERKPDRTTVRTLKKVAKALGVDVSTLI